MDTKTPMNDHGATAIFADPVAYLQGFGISAELVADTSLPVAA